MDQEGLMFRCGGARMTSCGQVREHIIVDFGAAKDSSYIEHEG